MFRRAEIIQEFIHFRDGQVINGVKVISAVAPFGKVPDIAFAAVAGSGDQRAAALRDSVVHRHAKARGNVRRGVGRDFLGLPNRRQNRFADGGEVHRDMLDAELLAQGKRVRQIFAVVAFGMAGHHNGKRVFAGHFA